MMVVSTMCEFIILARVTTSQYFPVRKKAYKSKINFDGRGMSSFLGKIRTPKLFLRDVTPLIDLFSTLYTAWYLVLFSASSQLRSSHTTVTAIELRYAPVIRNSLKFQ